MPRRQELRLGSSGRRKEKATATSTRNRGTAFPRCASQVRPARGGSRAGMSEGQPRVGSGNRTRRDEEGKIGGEDRPARGVGGRCSARGEERRRNRTGAAVRRPSWRGSARPTPAPGTEGRIGHGEGEALPTRRDPTTTRNDTSTNTLAGLGDPRGRGWPGLRLLGAAAFVDHGEQDHAEVRGPRRPTRPR